MSWYKANPKEAAELTVKTLDMLKAKGLEDSIAHVKLNYVSASNAKEDLEFFFNILKENQPKVIGGKLPNSGFYY